MSMSSEDGEDPILRTQGISSHVYGDGGDVIGHALLLDLDDSEPVTAHRVLDRLEGVRALLESSSGSYHLWSLGVDGLREQTIRALGIREADDAHAGASWRRGYGVLRIGPKRWESGECYKAAPSLRAVRISPSDRPQSRAHYAMLRTLAEDDPEWDAPRPRSELAADHELSWRGDTRELRIDHYQTLTDDAKEGPE